MPTVTDLLAMAYMNPHLEDSSIDNFSGMSLIVKHRTVL